MTRDERTISGGLPVDYFTFEYDDEWIGQQLAKAKAANTNPPVAESAVGSDDAAKRMIVDGVRAALEKLDEQGRDLASVYRALAAAEATIAAQAATITGLRAAIKSTRLVMATSSRDWGESRGDAWLYGIYLGWDREPDEGEEDDGETAMTELATRHRWPDTEVARLRSLKAAVDALMGGTDG